VERGRVELSRTKWRREETTELNWSENKTQHEGHQTPRDRDRLASKIKRATDYSIRLIIGGRQH